VALPAGSRLFTGAGPSNPEMAHPYVQDCSLNELSPLSPSSHKTQENLSKVTPRSPSGGTTAEPVSDQEPQSPAASGLSGFVPFPELAHLREMPCGGFAQEFCGGGITHELGDLEAELGLAAMMASIVHASCSGLYCSCLTRTSKIPAQLPSMPRATASGCDAD
jgi:hypothetical protein